MEKKIQKLLICIAIGLSFIIYLNQFILFKLNPKDFQNWNNDSLFYSISIILWSIIFPILYNFIKRFKKNQKVYVILQVLLFSFIISIIHQICSNLIFYVVLYFKNKDVSIQFLTTPFWGLILTGIFIRVIESIVITIFLYIVSNNEKQIRNFISSHWPRFYDFIIDKKGLIQIIKIKEKGTMVSLNVSEIMWFNSSGNYIEIHHLKKTYLIRQTMSSLILQLDSQIFLRVHRSYIININFIEQIDYIKNGEYKIILKDNSEITSSRNFKEDIQIKLKLKNIS